jgi:diacylglycerol O-acyltransferase-1
MAARSTSATSTSISLPSAGTAILLASPAEAIPDVAPPQTSSKNDGGGGDIYKHIYAIHSQPRTSTLSHDSIDSPSFIGFRNLMVIVLSTSSPITPSCAAGSR